MSGLLIWLHQRGRSLISRFGLAPSQGASRFWGWVYRLGFVLALLLVAFAFWGAGSWPSQERREFFLMTRGLFLSAALGLYLTLRVVSLVYGRPLRREAIAQGFLTRRPWLFLLLAALLHLESALGVPAAYGLKPEFPWELRFLVVVALSLCGLPFWLWVFHPLEIRRRAREFSSPAQRTKKRRLNDLLLLPARTLAAQIREISRAYQERRTPRNPR